MGEGKITTNSCCCGDSVHHHEHTLTLKQQLTKERLNTGQESLPAQVLAVDLTKIGNVEGIVSLGILHLGVKRGQTGLEHLVDGEGVDLGEGDIQGHLGLDAGLEDLDQGWLDQGGNDLELVLLQGNIDHRLDNRRGLEG